MFSYIYIYIYIFFFSLLHFNFTCQLLFYYHYYYFPFFLFFYHTSCTLFPTNKPLHPQCRRLIILEYEGELYRIEVLKMYNEETGDKKETYAFEKWCWGNYENNSEWSHEWPIDALVLYQISPPCSLEALVAKQKLSHFCPTIRRQDASAREEETMINMVDGKRRGRPRFDGWVVRKKLPSCIRENLM